MSFTIFFGGPCETRQTASASVGEPSVEVGSDDMLLQLSVITGATDAREKSHSRFDGRRLTAVITTAVVSDSEE